ncbi:uncharacterized protein [Porites lutea]|uniref:uncharacterized protein isoform X1 n=1 Tax=Porites lutea TaxID=51062 RepID=UPI003CC522BD
MVDSTHEELLPRPIEEEGQQKMAETFKRLEEILQKNPDVLTNLLQTQGRGIAERSKFHLITSALAAVACGSWSWIWFRTALTDVLNAMKEIPKESRAQLDKMEKDLGEVKWKHEKVLHDTTKMQEKIQTAAKRNYRISRNDDLEIEMGLINSTCVLGTCQDALMYLEADISDLQDGAKRTPTHILKQVVIIISLLIAAALTVGSHWTVCSMIFAVILFICKRNVQGYFTDKLLLTKCEDFRKNELREAEKLHKQLKRDVEFKVPTQKKTLAVLDIEVSLFHPHSE